MAGQGREAAFAAAVLGDNALMEKAWQDTGMLAEAVLHAHVIQNKHLFPFQATSLIVTLRLLLDQLACTMRLWIRKLIQVLTIGTGSWTAISEESCPGLE